MAIFRNHIKGTGNATNNSNGLWTWIEWSKETEDVPDNGPYKEDYSGEILVSNSNGSPDDAKSLGKILTTNINASVYGSWNNYSTWNWKFKENDTEFDVLSIVPGKDRLDITTPKITVWTIPNVCSWTFQEENGTEIILDINHEESKNNTWISTFYITNTGYIKTTGYIHTDDKCEASYFNATSDKRAKENIIHATFSGLNLINKLPVYTFNYKNKTDVVPGILAQDLLEAQPEELNLVDNIAATGENGDYMSIKADKLIFVLMQAIKEQQTQIDELKAELKKLTK